MGRNSSSSSTEEEETSDLSSETSSSSGPGPTKKKRKRNYSESLHQKIKKFEEDKKTLEEEKKQIEEERKQIEEERKKLEEVSRKRKQELERKSKQPKKKKKSSKREREKQLPRAAELFNFGPRPRPTQKCAKGKDTERTIKFSFYLHRRANQSTFEKEKWDKYTARGIGWKEIYLPLDGNKKKFKKIIHKAYPILQGKHFFFATCDGRSKRLVKLFGRIPEVNEFRLQFPSSKTLIHLIPLEEDLLIKEPSNTITATCKLCGELVYEEDMWYHYDYYHKDKTDAEDSSTEEDLAKDDWRAKYRKDRNLETYGMRAPQADINKGDRGNTFAEESDEESRDGASEDVHIRDNEPFPDVHFNKRNEDAVQDFPSPKDMEHDENEANPDCHPSDSIRTNSSDNDDAASNQSGQK